MDYYYQTQRLLRLYNGGTDRNVLVHFFSQLQQLRFLYSIALINAISAAPKAKGPHDLIRSSITWEPYMKHITLSDIRNQIVFIIRKEFNEIIRPTPYVHPDETDATFLAHDRPSTIGLHVKKLGKLIETCFYIRHVFVIVRCPEQIVESRWNTYHETVHRQPLFQSVKEVYELLRSLTINNPSDHSNAKETDVQADDE